MLIHSRTHTHTHTHTHTQYYRQLGWELCADSKEKWLPRKYPEKFQLF